MLDRYQCDVVAVPLAEVASGRTRGFILLRGFGLAVLAVQAIRRMRGGAQSQLMLGADGKLWGGKFQNNPRHLRVLANVLIATCLAAAVGLTVPASDEVEGPDWQVGTRAEMLVALRLGRGEG